MLIKADKVKKAREEALAQIEEILAAGDVEAQFASRQGGYYSKDKFIVTWIGNYKGMPAEFSVCKTDAFYKDYSGSGAIYTTQGLFHEKQLGGYKTIERALLEVGLKLCPNRKKKLEFFNTYGIPYNEKLNHEKISSEQS